MNNSKHLKAKKENKDKHIEKKPIPKFTLPWIIVSAVVLVALVVGVLFDQFYESPILSIDGKKYALSDVAYYFYSAESSYDYYDQMFGGGGVYWDMTYDDKTGATVRDEAKKEAVDSAIKNEIIYKEATAEGYTLSDDEKTTVSKDVDTLLTSKLTSSQITKGKFTKDSLTDVLDKIAVVARYRQDKIDSFNIDDEAIKAGVNYDDYRQYDIETLFISTKKTDDSGNSVDMTADEKKTAYDKISSYYDKAKSTEDWSTLIPTDETEVTYSDTNFLESGSTYSEDMEKMMMAMNIGDVSDVYEAESGYYIVRMKNNNSTESYDNAVKNAISQEEEKQFTAFYDELAKKHEFKTYDKTLKSMKMGTVILN